MISREQFQLFLDFDLWKRDRLNEEHFWSWLELPDESNELTILQKLLQSIDLKVLCLIFSRYVDTVTNEEPTEEAPDIHFSTPDKGYTWIRAHTQDEHKDFLLKRLLALIFETDADLFYQLLSVPSVSTPSMLEEESYQERSKRMESEGVPSLDSASELHTGISLESTIKKLTSSQTKIVENFNIRAVRPLVYHSRLPSPLRDLVSQIQSPDQFETEITLLLNSGCVYWAIDFSDREQLEVIAGFIRGCINLSLEALSSGANMNVVEIYQTIGLIEIYRTGLSIVMNLKELALDVPQSACNTNTDEAIVSGLKMSPPLAPDFLNQDGSFQDGFMELKSDDSGKLASGFHPLEHMSLIQWLKEYLRNISTMNLPRS